MVFHVYTIPRLEASIVSSVTLPGQITLNRPRLYLPIGDLPIRGWMIDQFSDHSEFRYADRISKIKTNMLNLTSLTLCQWVSCYCRHCQC